VRGADAQTVGEGNPAREKEMETKRERMSDKQRNTSMKLTSEKCQSERARKKEKDMPSKERKREIECN
jgi:hypothetical protein